MRQHVHEVQHDDVEVVLPVGGQLRQQFLGTDRIVHFVVGERVLSSVALQLRLHQGRFIQILSLFRVFIDPQLGKHFLYLIRHQSGKNRVSGILSCRRQNATVEILLNGEHIGNLVAYHTPLVEPEIVNDN